MKVQELRIGNLVYADLYNEEPILVESICNINREIYNSTTGEIPFHSINPIPLTEEWLLKLPKKITYPSWIKYLHELQNWYYWNNEKKELHINL